MSVADGYHECKLVEKQGRLLNPQLVLNDLLLLNGLGSMNDLSHGSIIFAGIPKVMEKQHIVRKPAFFRPIAKFY